MQSVSAAFTAEEKDSVRKIAHSLQVSWHKQTTLGNRTFTIGVSTIGGTGVIGINPGSVGSPGNYKYFDESQYVTSLAWERGLNIPTGGLTKALAEAHLDNTTERFTPRYMGGRSELYTAIQPRKPLVINAGFNFGVDQTIPQFAGIIDKQPRVDQRNRSVTLQAADYVDFFQGRYLDQAVMFTSQRTDQVMGTLLAQQGMNTAQYDLDTGINVIGFGLFDTGTKLGDAFNQLAEAENGHFFQDESGIFKFHNRQWGDSSPYNAIQKVITTAQVIAAEAPSDDHIINVVEVKGQPRAKQPNQLVYQSTSFAGAGNITVPGFGQVDVWFNFPDPMLSIDTPAQNAIGVTSFFIANAVADGTGTDLTGNVYVKNIAKFAQACKITFANNAAQSALIIALDIWGRPAQRSGDVYYRTERGNSITAFERQSLMVDNDFIQSNSWAASYGQMIVNDFSQPENLQKITIRAIPELQLYDLISWQGRYWRLFDIKSTIDPSIGYVQELTMLQRTITTYFRIGISTIGGGDKIAP